MFSPSDINTILGIDSSIDIAITDPVANKGDGGINDFYYEKGSQLTVLALALQNISNNMNSSSDKSQDYFKAISEELEKEYGKYKSHREQLQLGNGSKKTTQKKVVKKRAPKKK